MSEKKVRVSRRELQTVMMPVSSETEIRLEKIKRRISRIKRFISRIPPPDGEGCFIAHINSPGGNFWHRIEDSMMEIGRSDDAAMVVRDGKVSRVHCVLECGETGCRLLDNGSRNGTYVNGEKHLSRELCDGDLIRIGDTELLFIRNDLLPEAEEDIF